MKMCWILGEKKPQNLKVRQVWDLHFLQTIITRSSTRLERCCAARVQGWPYSSRQMSICHTTTGNSIVTLHFHSLHWANALRNEIRVRLSIIASINLFTGIIRSWLYSMLTPLFLPIYLDWILLKIHSWKRL